MLSLQPWLVRTGEWPSRLLLVFVWLLLECCSCHNEYYVPELSRGYLWHCPWLHTLWLYELSSRFGQQRLVRYEYKSMCALPRWHVCLLLRLYILFPLRCWYSRGSQWLHILHSLRLWLLSCAL